MVDYPRFEQFFIAVDQQQVQAIKQVTEILLLVAARGRPRKIGSDGLHQDLHAAQTVEFDLCRLRVGQNESKDVATYVLIIVDHLMIDYVVRHYSIS